MKDKELKELIYSQAKKSKFSSFAQYAISKGYKHNNFSMRIRTYFINLNNWLRPLGLEVVVRKITTKVVLFDEVSIGNPFDIEREFGIIVGHAEFVKLAGNRAICMKSQNSTYEKGETYTILKDQECIICLNQK